MGAPDKRDMHMQSREGVVDRIFVLDWGEVSQGSGVQHTSRPVVSWAEHILVCHRDDGAEEEFQLDPKAPESQVLLALSPGDRVVKESGAQIPRPI